MAGRGPAPKEQSRTRHEPQRGDWKPAAGVGWQHGDIPKAPTGLTRAARDTWLVWFAAWFAAHWSPDDLPILRQLIRLYDKVEREQATAADLTQYRQFLDSYGITPKGQQDRRWQPPKDEAPTQAAAPATTRFAHLKVVDKAG